jgi:signal transduction histidine kinase
MREERLLLLFLLVLAAAVVVLLVLLFSGSRSRTALELELEADRIATEAFQAYLQGSADPVRVDERVLGFGIYSAGGATVDRWGSAPPALDLHADPRHRMNADVRIDPAAGVLHLVRPVGMNRLMPMMRQPMRGPGAGLIYLEMRIGTQWRRQRLSTLAAVAVPSLVGVLVAAVAVLYKRNTDYRRRMAAQMRLAQLGEAARTLAHEIKNPLGAIRIQTGYLKKTLPPDRGQDLSLIEQEVQRLSTLADRIGSFLRDPVGKQHSVDLGDFLARFADPGRVELRVQETAPVRVLFDPDRLRSVVENLLANAEESQHEAGVIEPVRIEVDRVPGYARIVVRDHGLGLHATEKEKLFDPFYTTKTRGSGVGLALVRRFVEAAGGEVLLRDADRAGAEAVVRIREAKP